MYRKTLAALCALLFLFTAGCGEQKSPQSPGVTTGDTAISTASSPQPPRITVMAGDDVISTVAAPDSWGISEGGGPLLAIMKGKSREDVPYVRLGETVTVTFDGAAPDSAELKDRILRPDGSGKYDDRVTEVVSVKLEGNQCMFTLGANMAAMLSSNSTDYEPGATIRGFRLTCTWGKNQCEYAFILRSDVGMPTGEATP